MADARAAPVRRRTARRGAAAGRTPARAEAARRGEERRRGEHVRETCTRRRARPRARRAAPWRAQPRARVAAARPQDELGERTRPRRARGRVAARGRDLAERARGRVGRRASRAQAPRRELGARSAPERSASSIEAHAQHADFARPQRPRVVRALRRRLLARERAQKQGDERHGACGVLSATRPRTRSSSRCSSSLPGARTPRQFQGSFRFDIQRVHRACRESFGGLVTF